MEMVGLAVTTAGSNTDLNDPLAVALIGMGMTPTSFSSVTDADISGVTSDKTPEFLDRAELRLLETISGNTTLVDISVGPRSQSFGQFSQMIEKSIDRLKARMAADYGIGLGSLSAGNINLDFVSKGNDTVIL